jgi:hypothetical protein
MYVSFFCIICVCVKHCLLNKDKNVKTRLRWSDQSYNSWWRPFQHVHMRRFHLVQRFPGLLKFHDGNSSLPLASQVSIKIRSSGHCRSVFVAGIGHPEAHLGHNTRKDEIGVGGTKVPILGARSEGHFAGQKMALRWDFTPRMSWLPTQSSLKYFAHPPLDKPASRMFFILISMSQWFFRWKGGDCPLPCLICQGCMAVPQSSEYIWVTYRPQSLHSFVKLLAKPEGRFFFVGFCSPNCSEWTSICVVLFVVEFTVNFTWLNWYNSVPWIFHPIPSTPWPWTFHPLRWHWRHSWKRLAEYPQSPSLGPDLGGFHAACWLVLPGFIPSKCMGNQ